MTAISRIELRCEGCPATAITDADPDRGDVIVPSKWSTVSVRGGFGDNLSLSKHFCPTCTEHVLKAVHRPRST